MGPEIQREACKAKRTWNDKGWWGFLAASPPLLEVAAVAMVLCGLGGRVWVE